MSPSQRSRSRTPIDILIPAIDKDLGTLPHVIDAARKYVRHPIRSIMIVAPRSRRIMELCRRKQVRFVDETRALPITKKNIHYRSKGWERSGWLYQQFLKMNGDTLGKAKFFLVIDADTVFIRPHRFRIRGKTVMFCRDWSQPEYFRTYRRLLGKKPTSRVSFVTHYMLFQKSRLAKLKRTIEKRHRMPWYRAIMRSMNLRRKFAFSEFETYGNYVYARSRKKLILKPALNKSLSMSASRLTGTRKKRLAASYRSVSFHKRKDYVIRRRK